MNTTEQPGDPTIFETLHADWQSLSDFNRWPQTLSQSPSPENLIPFSGFEPVTELSEDDLRSRHWITQAAFAGRLIRDLGAGTALHELRGVKIAWAAAIRDTSPDRQHDIHPPIRSIRHRAPANRTSVTCNTTVAIDIRTVRQALEATSSTDRKKAAHLSRTCSFYLLGTRLWQDIIDAE